MQISKNDIKTLSAKTIKERAKREAEKAIDNARAQAMNLESVAIETAKNKVNEALDECKTKIEEKIKEETGYTIQEARYLTIEAYKKAKEMIDDGKSKVKNLSKEMKVKKPESLKEIVKKMPDELYNAFFLNEILEAVDKAKTVAVQTRDLGTEAIDEVTRHISFIRDNFKGEGILEVEKAIDKVKSSVSIESENQDFNSELVSELGKSKVSTSGKEYDFSDKKKLSGIAKTALQGLLGILPVLEVLKHLIENYRINKNGLREDSAERIDDLFEASASGNQISAKSVFDPLFNLKNDKESYDNINENIQNVEYSPDKVNMTSDSSVAYVSEKPSIISELDRIYIELSSAVKTCKYDKRYNLINKSTLLSGGLVDNLKYAGNNKEQLVDAIESLEPIRDR